jgi:dihydroneopterin aldolase
MTAGSGKGDILVRSAELWDGSRDYVRVMLRDIETEAQVGLHPWERHPERPTRLVVNVEMFAHLGPAAPAGQAISNKPHIDYDTVRSALRAWPTRPHTPLLESLAEELVAACFEIAAVEACRVSIVKPDIFNEAAGVGVELYRVRPPRQR